MKPLARASRCCGCTDSSGCGDDWRHIFQEPPAGYRLIAPDLRGHGASTNPSEVFTFREAARDISALLDHLDLSHVKAIGLSGGGIVLLHLATSHKTLIDSMVVVSAAGRYFRNRPGRFSGRRRRRSSARPPWTTCAAVTSIGEPQIRQLLAQSRAFADVYDDVSFTPPYCRRSPLTRSSSLATAIRSIQCRSPSTCTRRFHGRACAVVPGGGHGPVFGAQAGRFVETALQFFGEAHVAGVS